MGKFIFKTDSFVALHRFGDILDRALTSVQADGLLVTAHREAPDSIGRHWYGSRVHVIDRQTGRKFYLHVGLIYLPETRVGLMVEVDKNSNPDCYSEIWDNMRDGQNFEVCKDEGEYLKLFYTDASFGALRSLNADAQVERLKDFFAESFKAVADAAAQQKDEGFCLDYQDLSDAYHAALAFEDAINSLDIKGVKTEIEYSRDNFGSYAEGYRLWVTAEADIKLYVYFGAIYSCKKDPKGIFSEIDWLNNQAHFDKVFAELEETNLFVFSRKEPKFIKLFMPQDAVDRLNEKDYEAQVMQLTEFLADTVSQMVKAAQK